MVEAFERLSDRLVDALHQLRGLRRIADRGLKHRKLVAAEPRCHVAVPEAAAQAIGHTLEKLVADQMSERIVDALEFVDVDIEHGQLLAGPDRAQRLLEPLAKQRPVGQVGQRVVMRHMGDLLVGARALGDILDGGHPSAGFQRLVHDLEGAAAGSLRQLTRGLAERHVADDGVAEFVDIAIEGSGLLAVRDQPRHGAAGPHYLGRQPEHLEIRLVADHDAGRGVVEHEPLRDIVHGDRKLASLRRQSLFRQFDGAAPTARRKWRGSRPRRAERIHAGSAAARCRSGLPSTTTQRGQPRDHSGYRSRLARQYGCCRRCPRLPPLA